MFSSRCQSALALGVLPLLADHPAAVFCLAIRLRWPCPFCAACLGMTDGCLSLCAAIPPRLCFAVVRAYQLWRPCVQTQQALFVSPCGLRFSEGLFFKTVHGVLAFSLCSVLVRHITLPSVGTVSVSAIGFGRRLLFSTGLLFISALVLCLLCLCMSAYTLAYRKRTR
ncbi:MAG: hypothetical protein ACLT0Y_05955 [Christensenellales bacterium]